MKKKYDFLRQQKIIDKARKEHVKAELRLLHEQQEKNAKVQEVRRVS
jgi:hypothetical protein